jgi:hypothetical protein
MKWERTEGQMKDGMNEKKKKKKKKKKKWRMKEDKSTYLPI